MKQNPVTFTPEERRIFELPQGEILSGPEAEALRKVIDMFPSTKIAAESRYNPKVVSAAEKFELARMELMIAFMEGEQNANTSKENQNSKPENESGGSSSSNGDQQP